MNLLDTFDTHIKAISTAEEWAQYKAMVNDMSTENEIAKKHLDEWNSVTGFVEEDTGYYFELLSVMEDAMQEHKSETLQELKAKVRELEQCYEMSDHVWHDVVKREDVITIIDEAINE